MLAMRDLVTFKCQMTEAEAKKSTLPSQAGREGCECASVAVRHRAGTGCAGEAHTRQEWAGGTTWPWCLGLWGGRGWCLAQQNPESMSPRRAPSRGVPNACGASDRREELAHIKVLAFEMVKSLLFSTPVLSHVSRDSVARVLMG